MKSVVLHGLLAAFGLGLSYQTWTREEKEARPAGEVTIAACERDALSEVVFERKTRVLTARPSEHSGETSYWFVSQPEPEPEPEPTADAGAGSEAEPAEDMATADKEAPASDADDPAGAAQASAPEGSEPEKPVQPRPYDPDAPVEFLGNAQFADFVNKLCPLRGVRRIGQLNEAQLAEFGFGEDTPRLRLIAGPVQAEIEIGDRTYGAGHRYARRKGEREVFLLDGRVVSDLQSARYRFMQSALHDFTLADVDSAVITAGEAKRQLKHRARNNPKEARWVDAAEPDRRNELFNTWFQRVSRLKARSYLARDSSPGSDLAVEASDPTLVMTITYALDDEPKDKLELVRVDAADQGFYYARTETTRSWVVLHDSLAKQVEDDLSLVLGAEDGAAPPAEQGQNTPSPKGQPAHAH